MPARAKSVWFKPIRVPFITKPVVTVAACITFAVCVIVFPDQTGRLVSELASLFAAIFVFCLLVGIYLFPSILAYSRDHQNTQAIAALNLLLGWTFIGWVLALVWALTNPPKTT